MARRALFALLALGPLVVVLDHATDAGDLTLFPLAAFALVPLAWLIGEATEQAASTAAGGLLLGAYAALVVAFYFVGDR